MKLDRNILTNEGRGKYALLKLRDLALYKPKEMFGSNPVMDAVALLEKEGLIDWGEVGTDREFFVMRLIDKYAADGLFAYSQAAHNDDPEWAVEVAKLASRAGPNNPHCKRPD